MAQTLIMQTQRQSQTLRTCNSASLMQVEAF